MYLGRLLYAAHRLALPVGYSLQAGTSATAGARAALEKSVRRVDKGHGAADNAPRRAAGACSTRDYGKQALGRSRGGCCGVSAAASSCLLKCQYELFAMCAADKCLY
jgi:hypothetical protein